MDDSLEPGMSELAAGDGGRGSARAEMLCVAGLVAVAVLLLVDFSGLTIRSLAARHAAATLDFYTRHRPFDVQYNHELYANKLPFGFWLMSVPLFLFGPSDAALRMVSELFGIGLVLMTYFLGRRMFNRTAGVFGGMAAAANFLHPWVVKHSLLDSSALFLLSLPMVFFYLGWRDEKRRTVYVFLFYGASAVATWHRGPSGFVLPGLAVGAVLVPLRQWRVLRQFLNPWGIAAWVVLVGSYVLALDPGQLKQIVFGENLGHFLQGENPGEAARPFYYVLAMYLFRYLPWTGFLVAGLVQAVSRRKSAERSELWFLGAWLGSWLLFWQLSASFNETYLLVMLIPTSLFVGYALDGVWRDAGSVARGTAGRMWLLGSFALLAVTCAAMPIVTLRAARADGSMATWGIITAALGVVGLVALVLSAVRNYRGAIAVGVALSVAAGAVLGLVVKPMTDRKQPGEALFAQVRGMVEDRPVMIYGNGKSPALIGNDHAAILYLRSPHVVQVVRNVEDVQKGRKETAGSVVFAPESARDELSALSPRVTPVRCEDSSGGYLLYFPAEVLNP